MGKVVGLAAFVATILCFGFDDAQAQTIPRGNQYSMAGCGLGTLVFQNDETWWKQVLSSTTNGTFGTQTFGITSGTSNCNPGGGPTGRTASLFIDVNREAFAKDAARGSGETIDHLAAIMGCSDATAVGRTLKDNFKVIFATAGRTSDQLTDSVFDSVRHDETLASSCRSLS